MFHKVSSVTPLPNYHLSVSFENGETKQYDITPLFDKWEVFQTLKEVQGLFGQVKVDAGGYGISWNEEIDLACDELYYNGTAA